MSGTHSDLDENQRRIPIVGTEHWLHPEELIDCVVVQAMGRNVIVRLATGECVVVKSADLEVEDSIPSSS